MKRLLAIIILLLCLPVFVLGCTEPNQTPVDPTPPEQTDPTPPEQTDPEPTPPEQTFDPAPPGTFYDMETAYELGYLTRSDLMHFSYFTTGKVYEGVHGEYSIERTEIDFVPEYDRPDYTLTAQEDYNIRKNYFESHKSGFFDREGNQEGDENDLTVYPKGCYNDCYIIAIGSSLWDYPAVIEEYFIDGLVISVSPSTIVFRYDELPSGEDVAFTEADFGGLIQNEDICRPTIIRSHEELSSYFADIEITWLNTPIEQRYTQDYFQEKALVFCTYYGSDTRIDRQLYNVTEYGTNLIINVREILPNDMNGASNDDASLYIHLIEISQADIEQITNAQLLFDSVLETEN